MTDQPNPYRSPRSASEDDNKAATPRQLFRWREFFAVTLGFYGVLYALWSTMGVYWAVRWADEWSFEPAPGNMLTFSIHFVGAILVIVTGVQVGKGHWWGAGCSFVAAIILLIVAVMVTPSI